MVGQFSTPITPLGGSFLYADSHTQPSPPDCYQVETVKKFSVPASVRLFSSGIAKRNFLV